MGIQTDVADEGSVKAMVGKLKSEFGGDGTDVRAAAAVFNVSGPFLRKPFLEIKAEELDGSYAGSV